VVNQVYLTKESFKRIKKQLEELKTVKRSEIAERIQEAKDLGDLSENAEFSAAKNEQSFNEGKILELEDILRSAIMIEGKGRTDIVSIGSRVKVKINNSQEQEYTVVGDNDTDPFHGKISHRSPLGQAFLGKRVGESGEIRVPKGIMKFKIINIS